MRKLICLFATLVILSGMGTITTFSVEYGTVTDADISDSLSDSLNLEELYSELPDSAKASLKSMGIGSIGAGTAENVTFSSIINSILDCVSEQSGTIVKSFCTIIAVILIYALFEGFAQTITGNTLKEVLSVVCALCLACALVVPATEIIEDASKTISNATDFMLAYVPIMTAVLISCGKSLSSSGYYALMVAAAEGISQLCDKFITPMLNVFLGVSLCGTVIPQVNLSGITSFFAKTVKWLLSFTFTIFSALLTFKTLISTSVDTVSTRAVRYTVSSFIPVVGTALAEAYKTVQGSVNILKNGMGVFVIFAVFAVFLPIIIRLLMWLFSVNLCKNIAQIINMNLPVQMLSGVSTVLSVLLAVIICIMALYIISTALIITVGGGYQ